MNHHSSHNMETSMVVWRKCTPFCDKSVECPDHHELLQAIVNCTDQLGHLSNLDVLKNSIEKHKSLGWDKNEDIPDPVPTNRLPLVHWAACLGKCNALEWLLNSGFDPKVTVHGIGENALHRTVLYLYKSRPKFTTKELKPKFRKICGLLPSLISVPDHINNETPLLLAATLLVTSDSRLVFFQTAIEVMSAQTREMSEAQSAAALDARNRDGNTCLHILASVTEKIKSEHACIAIGALLKAGADKTIRNMTGQTPLDIAIQKGCNNIVDELVKIVYPTSHIEATPTPANNDPRSLMTMVDIPSRSRASPSSNTMVNVHRPYYASDSPRSPPRCRSPHRNSRSSESPPSLQSKYEDQDSIPIVEPGAFVIKQESAGLKSDAAENNQTGMYPMSPASMSDSNFDVNSPLLSHLKEAGLLNEVSDLLLRAKARDEGQLRRYQQQAKDLDTQIEYKLKEIERIKQEVESLRIKRTRCDDETANLRKRLSSCSNAIKELPGGGPFSNNVPVPPSLTSSNNL